MLNVPRLRGFLTLQLAHELLNSIEALLDVRHAGCVADAQIIVRTEGNSRYCGHFFRFQQFLAKLRRLQTGLRDVGEEIERALRVHACNSRNGIQFLERERTSLRKLSEPSCEMILRTR